MAAVARPLDLHKVAAQTTDIEVSLHGECFDPFPSALANTAEWPQHAGGHSSEFLGEFASGSRLSIFIRGYFTLGNRPRTEIPMAPERSAGMNEKNEKSRARALV